MLAPAPGDGGRSGPESVTVLKGVGPAIESRLQRLGIKTLDDLLFLLPIRYEDRTRVSRIGTLRPGDGAVIEATVELAEVVYRGRRSLLCHVADGTGSLIIRLFYFSKSQQEQLARGQRLRCYGEVRSGPTGPEMIHPEYRLIDEASPPPLDETLTPVYPSTEGLSAARLRRLTGEALERVGRGSVPELLPGALRRRYGFPDLDDALAALHRPAPDAELAVLAGGRHPAQRRLAFEELLAHHLCLRQLRREFRTGKARPLAGDRIQLKEFIESLPFKLTGAQERVLDEILTDLAKNLPMMRLVQGDVGSGKTVVAAAATIVAVASGYQAAIMAPTEILAEQHYRNLSGWLEPMNIRVAWLTGSLTAANRRESLDAIRTGTAQVVVGTHALFQEDVEFQRLALAVIDEQHRFGVHQRHRLREKGASQNAEPHQLIMTATPIPRTLTMTAYADLDVSVINELPPGRQPVTTVVIPDNRREAVVERVRKTCGENHQAYWVCPLIGESKVLEAQAAQETAAMLTEELPRRSVGLIHGRMKPQDKERVMQMFKVGDIDVLVATTVIEVGVDVPSADLMVIENAERLGLAQLHQLRGRVGRGTAKASCVLLFRSPLSEQARQRLAVMRVTSDGFEIAQRDLELRGPGEVLGTKQTGLMQLKVADLLRDADLLPDIRAAADQILDKHAIAVDELLDRWIGPDSRYGKV